LTVQDYTTILKRRWWIIAIPAIIFPIVGFGITFLVQPQYVSQTLVLVEQQKVPESYVKAVVTEDLNGRLATMKEQILSRSRLQPIIERFNLFSGGKLSMDDRIDLTRRFNRRLREPTDCLGSISLSRRAMRVQPSWCAARFSRFS
jgi:hypothetical protein